MATIMEKDVLLEMAHLGHLLPRGNEKTEEMKNDLTVMGKLWNEIMFTSCEEIDFEGKVEEIKKLRAKYE